MPPLSQADRERIGKLFNKLDVDKDGRVSVTELMRVVKNTSEDSDDRMKTAKRIIRKGTTANDDEKEDRSTLSFEEFLDYVNDTETQLKLAFKQLDRNKDGGVDAEEIRAAMKDLGVNVKLDDAKRLLERMDKDGSLKIDYNEWRDFLLFSGTTSIDEIFHYWRRASAIDIGESMLVPDDFTEKEKKTGEAWKTMLAGSELINNFNQLTQWKL